MHILTNSSLRSARGADTMHRQAASTCLKVFRQAALTGSSHANRGFLPGLNSPPCWGPLCAGLSAATSARGFSRTAVPQALHRKTTASKDEPKERLVDGTKEQKAKALQQCIADINKRWGKGSIMSLSSAPLKLETISSGALTLDIALGGGFPKGRIIEVYGPESSGKTTLALHVIAEVQRQGGNAVLIDAEHAFDPEYSRKVGVDIEAMTTIQPDSGEMALECVDHCVRSGAFDIICIDSVAALTPKAEIEGEVGAFQVGAQARLMSQALRKITANASKCKCTIIFLNQIRHKVGVIYGSPEVTSGGQALKFYASVRLEVRRKQTIEGGKGEGDIGIKVKAKVVKNKCAPPYKIAEFDILFGSGISTLGCLLDAAETTEVVERRGSWYYYGEEKLAQGREKTLSVLEERPELAEEVEKQTRAALLGDTGAALELVQSESPEEDPDFIKDDDEEALPAAAAA